jgi:hypothetical protein
MDPIPFGERLRVRGFEEHTANAGDTFHMELLDEGGAHCANLALSTLLRCAGASNSLNGRDAGLTGGGDPSRAGVLT